MSVSGLHLVLSVQVFEGRLSDVHASEIEEKLFRTRRDIVASIIIGHNEDLIRGPSTV